jgi:hypothetical protein
MLIESYADESTRRTLQLESPTVTVGLVIGIILAGNALVTTQIVFSQLVGHAIVAVGTLTCTGAMTRTSSSRPGCPIGP